MGRRSEEKLAKVSVKATQAVTAEPPDASQAEAIESGDGSAEQQPAPQRAVAQWLRAHGVELGICLFLVAAALAVFGRTIRYEFVAYDDNQYVYENRHVRGGLTPEGIVWAFTHVHASNWHPLTTLSHELDSSLYGLWAGGHHLTNVLLHAAAAVVLFLALRRLTGTVWPSGIVAALFCLHPLHVESVAWVSERKDVLSGLFFGLTLWAYAGYARRPFSWPRYATVVVLFALGLLCKPMLVTLPFVLLLLDYWPLGRMGAGEGEEGEEGRAGEGEKGRKGEREPGAESGEQEFQISNFKSQVSASPFLPFSLSHLLPAPRTFLALVVEKIPLFALAAASCAVTYLVQSSHGAVSDVEPWGMRVQTTLTAYVAYLIKMVWPIGLAAPYPRVREPDVLAAVGCGLALVVITLAVLYLARRGYRYLAVGWFWYLGMLVPVIGLITIGDQAMADRYTYLPLVGIFLAVVWGGAELLNGFARSTEDSAVGNALRGVPYTGDATESVPIASSAATRKRVPRVPYGLAIAAVLLALCGLRSFDQVHYWSDSETLLRHAIAVTRDNAFARTNLGAVLRYKGHTDDQQAAEYREALRISPNYYLAHNNLAFVLAEQGKLAEAIEHYQTGLRNKPDDPLALNNLGIALATLGRMPEAEALFRESLRLDPESARAEFNLGKALADREAREEGLEHLRRAVAWEPENPAWHVGLGVVLTGQGSVEEGIQECQTAINLNPNDVEARHELAKIYFARGNLAGAFKYWQEVLQRAPRRAEAVKGIGMVLLASGHANEAVKPLQFALMALPRDLEARKSLAFAWLAVGRTPDAIHEFREMLRQDPSEKVALNSLAWLLATYPDTAIRNGPEAVKLAQQAVALEKGDLPVLLDTLAAAYAEVGRFKEAVETAGKAQAAAVRQGNKDLGGSIQKRLELYRAGKPFREVARAKQEKR